jgi:hypothetical protein
MRLNEKKVALVFSPAVKVFPKGIQPFFATHRLASLNDGLCLFSQTRKERKKWRNCNLVCIFETQNKVTLRVERKFRDLCSHPYSKVNAHFLLLTYP